MLKLFEKGRRELEQTGSRVFTDDTVTTAILDVIRQAKEQVILVSPYNKFWDHLKNEVQLAVRRKVRVTAIYRDGEPDDDIHWLGSLGATIYAVDKLHAKIFLNESLLILTSMNLLEVSSKNSKEIALRIDDAATNREIRNYVQNRLIPLGRQVYPRPSASEKPSPARATWGRQPDSSPTSVSNVEQTRPARRTAGRQPTSSPIPASNVWNTLKVALTGGRCIRCRESIPYNPDKPLCEDDFRSWNRYQDPDYAEDYCHRCGREWETSYARPLCISCYRTVR